MTDNEIVKALEDILKNFDGKVVDFMAISSAIDLINRKQAEIEALIAGQETLQKYIAEKNAEIERLEYKVKKWKENYESSQVVVGDFREIINKQAKQLKTAKSEAIKEFAERLKESKIYVDVSFGYGKEVYTEAVTIIEIDRLAKEWWARNNGDYDTEP